MSEVIPGSTLNKLKATAEALRELRHGTYDEDPTNIINPLKIPVSLKIMSANSSILNGECEGNVFEFTAIHLEDKSSRCVIALGFTDEEELKLRYTMTKFPVDSSVVVNAIEDSLRAWLNFFN